MKNNGLGGRPAPLEGQRSDSSEADGRFDVVKRALQHIAADHEETSTGHRKRLPRDKAIRIAREACEALGWAYGKASIRS